MLATTLTDWGVFITSLATLLGVIGALLQGKSTSAKADTAATKASEVATAVNEVHAAVSTPPGSPTVGVLAADTNEVVKNGSGEVPVVKP